MINSGVSVREATEKDIESIMKIEHDSFPIGIRETKETFVERLSVFGEGFLVITDEGNEPIGYITSEIWKYNAAIDEAAFTLGHSIKGQHDPRGEEIYISSLGVLKERRGSGYGSLLFEALHRKVKREYPGITGAVLVVSENWTGARRIYKKYGFADVHIIKDFLTPRYEKWSNGIVMRKSLT